MSHGVRHVERNSDTFHLVPISRSRRHLTPNISETVRDTGIVSGGILIGTYIISTQECHFEWSWVTLSDLAKYSMAWSVARSLCDGWASCADCHEHLIGMYTYCVSLLQCQFYWMQQLCCLLWHPHRSVILINSQHCNVVLCIGKSLWYIWCNLLYWGSSVGVGRPFFITNQSTFSDSLLIS